MKELLATNKVLFSAIGGLIGSMFGEVDGVLYALFIFLIIDYVTGVFAAVVHKKLDRKSVV